jgi:hypothetical protein
MTIRLRDVIGTMPAGIDTRGVLFEFDGTLHRGFNGAEARLVEKILESPWLEELFDAGLVRFRRSNLSLENHDLVVEIERVPVVSYPTEWPTVMLREAGVMIARVGAALARHELGLHDAHPWNVLFDGTRPLWVDLGSIVEAKEVSKAWMWEYRRHIVLPLAVHSIGLRQLGDAIQRTHFRGWKARLDARSLRILPVRYWRLGRLRRDPVRFFQHLASYVEGMPDRGASTAWSGYEQGHGVDVGDHVRYNGKERAVDELLALVAPGTLIDIGANAGWFSRLAVAHGHSVVAVDTDDPTLGALYLGARRDRLPILPLLMDIMWPSGSYGLGLGYAAAPDRLRCDTALALAVLHHIVGRQGVTFGAFAKAMDSFARQKVIVEFIPRDDAHVSRWQLAHEPWYEPERFIAAMAPYFRHVRSVPSSPPPRVVMLFERDA